MAHSFSAITATLNNNKPLLQCNVTTLPPSLAEKASFVAKELHSWSSKLALYSNDETYYHLLHLIQSEYPREKTTLVDHVLFAFLFWNPTSVSLILQILSEAILKSSTSIPSDGFSLCYSRSNPPFNAFFQIFGSTTYAFHNDRHFHSKISILKQLTHFNSVGHLSAWIYDALSVVDVSVAKQYFVWLLLQWKTSFSDMPQFNFSNSFEELVEKDSIKYRDYYKKVLYAILTELAHLEDTKRAQSLIQAFSEALFMPDLFYLLHYELRLTVPIHLAFKLFPSKPLLTALKSLLSVPSSQELWTEYFLPPFQVLCNELEKKDKKPWFFDHFLPVLLSIVATSSPSEGTLGTPSLAHALLDWTILDQHRFHRLYQRNFISRKGEETLGMQFFLDELESLEDTLSLNVCQHITHLFLSKNPTELLEQCIQIEKVYPFAKNNYQSMVKQSIEHAFKNCFEKKEANGTSGEGLRRLLRNVLLGGPGHRPVFELLLEMDMNTQNYSQKDDIDNELSPFQECLNRVFDFVVEKSIKLLGGSKPSKSGLSNKITSTLTWQSWCWMITTLKETVVGSSLSGQGKVILRNAIFGHMSFFKWLLLMASDGHFVIMQREALELCAAVMKQTILSKNYSKGLTQTQQQIWVPSFFSTFQKHPNVFPELTAPLIEVIVLALHPTFNSSPLEALKVLWQQFKWVISRHQPSNKGIFGMLDKTNHECHFYVTLFQAIIAHHTFLCIPIMEHLRDTLFPVVEEAEVVQCLILNEHLLCLLVSITCHNSSLIPKELVERMVQELIATSLPQLSSSSVYIHEAIHHLLTFVHLLLHDQAHLAQLHSMSMLRFLIAVMLLPNDANSLFCVSIISIMVLLPEPFHGVEQGEQKDVETASSKQYKKHLISQFVSETSQSGVGATEWMLLRKLGETIRLL